MEQPEEALALLGLLVSRLVVAKAGRVIAVDELDERVGKRFQLHERGSLAPFR
jgi:hypothetical protein